MTQGAIKIIRGIARMVAIPTTTTIAIETNGIGAKVMVVAQEATIIIMASERSAIGLQQKIIIGSTSQTKIASGRITH